MASRGRKPVALTEGPLGLIPNRVVEGRSRSATATRRRRARSPLPRFIGTTRDGRAPAICQTRLSAGAGRVPALALGRATARASRITVRRPHRPLRESCIAMAKRSRSTAVRFHLATTVGFRVRGRAAAPGGPVILEGKAPRENCPFSREPVVVDCPKISNKCMEAPSLMQ